MIYDRWLYFIQAGDDGPVKIGSSRNPRARLAALQTSHHEPLHLRLALQGCTADAEANFHSLFADKRVRGEWFDIADEFPKIEDTYVRLQEVWFRELQPHMQRRVADRFEQIIDAQELGAVA